MPNGLSISHDSHGKCIDRAIEGQLARIAGACRDPARFEREPVGKLRAAAAESMDVERSAAVCRFIGGPIQEKVLAIPVEALEQPG